ncbi:hypothetical protein GCM10010286_04370 [Streptomyces toxytricini]|nr:hypothetical protein GCM10010286_04370 [Streptomyces toxytricini]
MARGIGRGVGPLPDARRRGDRQLLHAASTSAPRPGERPTAPDRPAVHLVPLTAAVSTSPAFVRMAGRDGARTIPDED